MNCRICDRLTDECDCFGPTMTEDKKTAGSLDRLHESNQLADKLAFDEQELIALSLEVDNEGAADFRIGFRYGHKRGVIAGYNEGLSVGRESVEKVLWDCYDTNKSVEEYLRDVKLALKKART